MSSEGPNNEELKYSMFAPQSARGLFTDYPELRKSVDPNRYNTAQVLFCWYYACEASPFSMIENDQSRARESINKSFGRKESSKMDPEEEKRYLSLSFPDSINHLIEVMGRYKMGPRVRAKKMIEKIITNYEKIIDVDVSKDNLFATKDGEEVDWSKKKAYVDACATVSKNLGSLIQQAEGDFGITVDKEDESELEDGSLLDDWHNQTSD